MPCEDGIGHQRTGAAEQLDAGKLAQLVVQGDGGRGAQRLLREQARGRRAFQSAQRGAIGGDGDLLSRRGRLEADGGRAESVTVCAAKPGAETVRGHGPAQVTVRLPASFVRPSGLPEELRDYCAGHRRAAAVLNGKGKRRSGLGIKNDRRQSRHDQCQSAKESSGPATPDWVPFSELGNKAQRNCNMLAPLRGSGPGVQFR